MRFSLRTHLFARLRLLVSVAAGILCYYLLPAHLGTLQRLLIGWNVLAWLYLTFIWFRMLRTEVCNIPRIARVQDQSAALVLSLVIFACMASLVAILSELPSLRSLSGTPLVLHIVLTALTLLASWTLLPSSFAMHYAHQHYLHLSQNVTPMIFPEKPKAPGYWDFLYYSFTIAVAAQTADVATGTTGMRKITLLQSIISFIFNLAILGLSVNVGAGLLS
ncbi:membrane protein [Klebsiella michiganensis]|nr:membrane protein [Klebsiella michiganensis]